jgi:hypothetical protein
MTQPRLPYDDASTPAQMATDALAVNAALHLPTATPGTTRPAERKARTPHPPFAVTDEAARLARRFTD